MTWTHRFVVVFFFFFFHRDHFADSDGDLNQPMYFKWNPDGNYCVQGKQAVLMSVITGDAVTVVRDMEDKEVVGECLKVLRELFKEQVALQAST